MIMNVITITMIIIMITEARPWLPAFWFGLTACKASPSWITGEWFCEQFVSLSDIFHQLLIWCCNKMRSVQIRAHWHQHNVHRAPIPLHCPKSIICYLCQCVISPTLLWDYSFYYCLRQFAWIPGWILLSTLNFEHFLYSRYNIGIFVQHWILNI